MIAGTKVYIRWYGKMLEGEVLDGKWMGMIQVRIPLDGHHPVALFMPQHVYDSPEKLTETPESPSKAESDVVSLTPEQYVAKVYVTDLLQRFKASHWDEAHNHLRVDSLDEFYRIWIQTHGGGSSQAEAPATLQAPMPKPVSVKPVPQNGTPSNAERSHNKKPAKAVELSLFE